MSTLSKIFADVKGFFSSVETSTGKFAAAFVKIFKKAPSALQVAENFINQAAVVITAAVALADPVAEPAVAAVLATIETALAGLQASLTAANSGQSFLANLENFAQTVPQLLAGIQVKNPVLQSTVTRIVNLVVGECKILVPAVQAWVKQIEGQAQTAAAGK